MKKESQNLLYTIKVSGMSKNFLLMLLVACIATIFPLILNGDSAIFYHSIPFYFTIIVLFSCVMYYGAWGLLASGITLLICGILSDFPSRLTVANSIANFLQMVLLYISYRLIHKIEDSQSSYMVYKHGDFWLSWYNIFLLISFFSYGAICFAGGNGEPLTLKWVISVYSALIFIASCIKIFVPDKNRKINLTLLFYLIFVSFLPSLVGSLVSAFFCQVPRGEYWAYVVRWTSSNFILLQTFGYIAFQYFYTRHHTEDKSGKGFETYDISSAFYYGAILLFNIIIIFLIYKDYVPEFNSVFFFPWCLGNVFLGLNLFFTKDDDADGCKKDARFEWFENRVITVEKNTSSIIAVISFLLPLSAQIMGNIPPSLFFLFVANIFCACISMCLIWVPHTNIKFIALLKTIKTIFYCYSITLLLVSSILILQMSL